MKSLLPSIIVLCTALANNFALAAADQPTQPAAGQAQNDNTSANEKLAPPRFSRGVDDIVKLTQAKVSDSVILAFVRNSSVPYRPSADEIIELRQLGVSEPVMTGMLDRGNELRQAAARAQAAAQVESQLVATSATPQPVTVRAEPVSATYYGYLPSYGYPSYYNYHPRYYYNYYPYRGYYWGMGYRGYYAGYRGGYRRYW